MNEHGQFCTHLSMVSPLTIVGDDEEEDGRLMEEVSCGTSNDAAMHPQKRKKRAKWKKPAGKPHHPRTGYNLFFRFERERILNQTDHVPIALNSVQSIQVHDNPSIKESAYTLRCRRAHSARGKVGFAGLTRNVAAKWKHLDPKIKDIFERKAAEDKERYKRELEVWQRVEKEKEENASSIKEPSDCPSMPLPVSHLESQEDPSVNRPVFQFASSESQPLEQRPFLNSTLGADVAAQSFAPMSFFDPSPSMNDQACNEGFDFQTNIDQHLFYPLEADEKASFAHHKIGKQDAHAFPGFPHDDPLDPNLGEMQQSIPAVSSTSYSRSSLSSFQSASFDGPSGLTNRIPPSTLGHFTGEVFALSSKLRNWMQEEFANSDHLTVQQRQDLERQMMSCSDNVRQLLLQLKALNAPVSFSEGEVRATSSDFSGRSTHIEEMYDPRNEEYYNDTGSHSMNYHMNQFRKSAFVDAFSSRSLHEMASIDFRDQRRRLSLPAKDDYVTSPGQMLSLRHALEESSSRSAYGMLSQPSNLSTGAVDPRVLYQRTLSDPTGCHSYSPPPPDRHSAAMHRMERHNSLPICEQVSACSQFGGCEEFRSEHFAFTSMCDMNPMPVTLEEERVTSKAAHQARLNSSDFDFSDEMAANLGDMDDTLVF